MTDTIVWKDLTLTDLGKVVTGKTPPTSNPEYFGGEIPFVTPTDMDDRRIISTTERYLSEQGAKVVKGSQLSAGAVMVSCIGSQMGKVAIAGKSCVTNQQINTIIVSPEYSDLFVYYSLSLRRDEIRSLGSGSAVPILNKSDFSNLSITVPPLSEQRAIAGLLGALDDKIELNRHMNRTIETMARMVFRSWFIDFEPFRSKMDGLSPSDITPETAKLFPSKFQNTDIGEIPVNWTVMSIEQVSERVAMGPFGSSIKVETFVEEGIPIISGQHLRGFMLEDSTYNFISLEHAERLKNANVYRGDVVFTHAGNVGNLAFIPEDSEYDQYVVSQRQFYVRCNLEIVTPSFITFYFQSPEGQHKLLANMSSVGVPSIAQPVSYLRSIKLPIPPKPILDEFENIVSPLLKKYRANEKESRTLASLRDTLLPKLMRGEVRVKEVEVQIE
jgi:type I restriction enzyme S subunit